jgi:SSS family transporter
MAIPAMAFATNLVWFFPGFMMIAGFFISAYLIYPLLRKLEITSTYEYLERRFNRGLRLIASAQAIIFQTFGRMSVIMVLPSLAIAAFTGIDVAVAVLLMGVLTTVYTAIGGFKAVIWTDVFQGVLMIVAPLLVIGYSIAGTPGGFSGSIEAAQAYQKLNLVIASWDLALPVFWILIMGTLFTILGGVGDQPVIQRVYSVPLKEVRRTALMFTACGIGISILTFGMGVFMFGFFRGDPSRLAPAIGNDQVVPLFVVQNLPAGICGLVIASIFAAAMSTLSSSMNSVATLVAEDFFPKASDRVRLLIMKGVSYGVGVIGTAVAVYMAKQEVTSMFAIWNKVIALLGGGFVGIYILGVFTTRANSFGAIAGGVASIVMTVIVDRFGAVHWMGYSVVAITTCIVVGYVASLLTGGSTRDLGGLTAFTAKTAQRSA